MDEEKRYLEPEEAVEDEEQGMFEHFRLDVDGGQEPIRVDKYMSSHLEDTSRHRIQCAIKAGYVFVNGKLAKAKIEDLLKTQKFVVFEFGRVVVEKRTSEN